MILLLIFLDLNQEQRPNFSNFELNIYRTIGYSFFIGFIPSTYSILRQDFYTSSSIVYYSIFKYMGFFIISYLLISFFNYNLIEGSADALVRLTLQFGVFIAPYYFFTNKSISFS